MGDAAPDEHGAMRTPTSRSRRPGGDSQDPHARDVRARLYDFLAGLPLVIDDYQVETATAPTSSGWTRVTTTIGLHGAGLVGRGEDVTYDDADQYAFAPAKQLPKPGSTTIDGFSQALDRIELCPHEPIRAATRHYRRWAFESAALDLALQQAGIPLATALDQVERPVRFVVSTRLDARDWLRISPSIELKLDPTPDWTPDYLDALAASGRVRILDFKGHSIGGKVRQAPNPALYRTIATRFAEAILEDPVLTAETTAALLGVGDRLSWDAPIHSLVDVDALACPPRYLNIKPSRFGTVAAVLDCIQTCQDRGVTLYGGGQYELHAGRGQIQQLASLFYPDAPNDVAPTAYNDPTPRTGLPRSPLEPPAPRPGFGWPVTDRP